MYADNVNFAGGKSPTVSTDGQLLVGSTVAPNIKVGTITSPGGTITVGYSSPNITLALSGVTNNLGISYSSGTFTVLSSNGTALSATNPAYVKIQSKTTPGIYKTIAVTANQDFIDDAGASEIIGNLFGLPTGVAYTEDIPFYIYAVLNDAEDTVKFACSRVPNRVLAPASANIGCPGTANADTQGSIFIFDTVTIGDYDTNPCISIGSFRMRMSASDDWTVQTLDAQEGVGLFSEAKIFNVPLGTFGASTSTFLKTNGGTAPRFTTNLYTYSILRSGRVEQSYFMDGDPGTDGSGGVIAYMCAPIVPAETQQVPDAVCLLVYAAGATVLGGYAFYDSTGVSGWRFNSITAAVANITNGLFTNGARTISGKLFYSVSIA